MTFPIFCSKFSDFSGVFKFQLTWEPWYDVILCVHSPLFYSMMLILLPPRLTVYRETWSKIEVKLKIQQQFFFDKSLTEGHEYRKDHNQHLSNFYFKHHENLYLVSSNNARLRHINCWHVFFSLLALYTDANSSTSDTFFNVTEKTNEFYLKVHFVPVNGYVFTSYSPKLFKALNFLKN